MKQVKVIKNGSTVQFANFSNDQDMNDWIQMLANTAAWGKPERTIPADQIEGENIGSAIETIADTENNNAIIAYKFAAEYSTEIADITAQVEAQKKISDRAKKRAFGEAMIDKISAINDSKNLDVSQVDAFMSNALISSLREHLWAGNITTFVSKLAASDVSAFFTNIEKQNVITECQQFLLSIEG